MPPGKSGITRTRPTLSCIECKRRKIKCDKQHPVCNNCKRLKDVCNYNPFPGRDSGSSTPTARQQNQGQQDVQKRASVSGQSNSHTTAQSTPGTSPEINAVREQHALPLPDLTGSLANPGPLSTEATLSLSNPYNGPFHRPSGSSTADSLDPSNDDISTLMESDTTASIYSHGLLQPSAIGMFGQLSADIDFSYQDFDQHPDAALDFEPQQTAQQATGYLQKWTDHQIERLSHVPPSPFTQNPTSHESAKLTGLLTAPQGSPRRYVGSPFWGLAGNRLADCGLILQAQQTEFQARLQDPSRVGARSEILKSLPPKWLCDALIDSFFLGVKPLLPLVHETTFRSKYNLFWSWYTERRSARSVEEMKDNVSFPCLLWSILFCGAVAAGPTSLEKASVRLSNHDAFIARLRSKLDLTLAAHNFVELPTLDGLVAALLAQECDPFVDDIMSSGAFVAQVLQIARTLGLHNEETIGTFPDPDAEMARRTWYHILQLEVSAAIFSGNSPSTASLDSSFTTRMPHEFNDASMEIDRSASSSAEPQTSTAMLMAIGRYEMSQIMRQILDSCFNHAVPSEDELSALISNMRRFERRIDALSDRMEVPGLPQYGNISSQLLKTNPRDHKQLYEDNPDEENILNNFAAIVLSMMKDWASTLLNRRFLHQNSDKTSGIWQSQILLSSHFLKNYLHLTALPAFEPYRWCYPSKLQPLQDCMLVLTYLQDNHGSDDAHHLKYLLMEIFDIFQAKDKPQTSELSSCPGIRRYEACWQYLERIRLNTFASMEKSTPRKVHASSSRSSYFPQQQSHQQQRPAQQQQQQQQYSQYRDAAQNIAQRAHLQSQQTNTAGFAAPRTESLQFGSVSSPSFTGSNDFFGSMNMVEGDGVLNGAQRKVGQGEDWIDLVEM